MNDDNELDPVARLRAADPAAGVEPRAGFADEVIVHATSETAHEDAAEAGAAAGAVTDLDAERARRRPRWLAIAAVAASVAIVGGAGFGLGAMTGGSPTLAAAPPISLQSGATGSGAMEGATQEGPGSFDASGRKMVGSGASDMMMPYGFGRNSFSASGLSTTDGTASAYAFDARSASTSETVAALAVALGMEGTPALKDGSWTVGPQDGSAPTLYVALDGTLGFSYSDPRINPWACLEPVEPVDPVPSSPDGAEPELGIPEAPACEPDTAALPSESAAIDALRSLIAATGRDAGAFEYTSETWEGAVTRMAQAWPVIDGQRIDQAWSIELASEGISSASGALAGLVSIGDYDVVSDQQAFERLSDPRFGAQMTAMPFAAAEAPVEPMVEEWVAPTEPPATPTNGSPVSWPVRDVTIISAHLGLASQWQPDGSVLIVPAYAFTDGDGGTWSVIAVAESKLEFASE
ncbi:hypothetical protein [Agromyces subbeticus]|uniref:hypothetical protein n=1 Tax=Agromyces subbeticus TaxID=293890 RepID=UPI00041390E6|nr:hypothetical protein [Agromyces subbeticus]